MLSQSLGAYEIIVIDDGSTPEVRAEYRAWLLPLQEQNRARLIELETNSGPSRARNVGWNEASGTCISFLDADDSWHPEKLARISECFKRVDDAWMIAHRYEVVGDGPKTHANVGDGHVIPINRSDWLKGNPVSTPTVTLRREMSHRFDETRQFSEDYHLWLHIYFTHGGTYLLDERLTYLHKAPYGASGLSSRLWDMEKGELSAILSLRQNGHISLLRCGVTLTWSWTKYLRRVVLIRFRKRS